jgi:hypothetical protein
MNDKQADDQYSPEETAERFARNLRRLLNMPPSTQRPLKQRKRGRPRKRKLKPPRVINDP